MAKPRGRGEQQDNRPQKQRSFCVYKSDHYYSKKMGGHTQHHQFCQDRQLGVTNV